MGWLTWWGSHRCCMARQRRFTVYATIIKDGDSLTVRRLTGDTREFEVRLFGIDAPEHDQPLGQRSTDYLHGLVAGKLFHLEVKDIDHYQRIVGILYESDLRNSINRQMVEAGLAYHWPRYGRLHGGQEAQEKAQKQRAGIWQDTRRHVHPWAYRRGVGKPPPRSRPRHQTASRPRPTETPRKSWSKTQEFFVGFLVVASILLLFAFCGSY